MVHALFPHVKMKFATAATLLGREQGERPLVDAHVYGPVSQGRALAAGLKRGHLTIDRDAAGSGIPFQTHARFQLERLHL